MDGLLQWGIDVVLWFQRSSPQLDGLFKGFTFLGDQEFFLVLLPLVYWSIDRTAGFRLMMIFMISATVNQVAKEVFDQLRPYQYDDRVMQLVDADPLGFPSGHTQSTLVVWGYLATRFRRSWLWALTGFLVVAVPASRIYVGVHFPTDIVGGYIFGLAVLLAALAYGTRVERWFFGLTVANQILMAIAAALSLAAFWPSEPMATGAGAFVGITAGLVLERRQVKFSSDGTVWARVLRFVVGAVVLFGIWTGLKILFDGWEPVLVWRFVRYATVGMWGALGAPWLFVVTHLARSERVPAVNPSAG